MKYGEYKQELRELLDSVEKSGCNECSEKDVCEDWKAAATSWLLKIVEKLKEA